MKKITIAMLGAGRASQLHMDAYRYVKGVELEFKTIVSNPGEKLKKFAQKYNFKNYSSNFDDILNDDAIDVIDICTPPYAHLEQIIKAFEAKKHVICEKPLTGFFGDGINNDVPYNHMDDILLYKNFLKNLEKIKKAQEKSKKILMYAENFIYAPSIIKAEEIISLKKSKILFIKAEESLSGSSSPVAGKWAKTGGGTFIRAGIHALSAALYLKRFQSSYKDTKIYPKSVIANTTNSLKNLTDYEKRHIKANPIDVEDSAAIILEFSDDTLAVIMSTDTCLGGSENYIRLYCNDANIHCQLTMNDMMKTYFLDEDGLEDVYLSEMLPSKLGWNKPFILDEFVRGYVNQMEDFIDCIKNNKKPKSDINLALEIMKVVYGAYLSAYKGKKIFF